jgi:large subunit ribosomal protein L25
MEHDLVLTAEPRKVLGKGVRHLRKQGALPIVLYGKEVAPISLAVSIKSFRKVFREAGQSSLVDLKVDEGKPVKTLVQDVQFDPVTDEVLHADLYQVKMTEKVKTDVPLKFTGEAAAVKEQEGTLVTPKDHVTIEALPTDLLPEIEVDISPLQTFEDAIKVADIKAKVPANVTVLDSDEEVVAQVTPPRSEEELAELAAPTVSEEEQVAALEQKLEEEKAAKETEKAEGEEGGEAATPTQPQGEQPPK